MSIYYGIDAPYVIRNLIIASFCLYLCSYVFCIELYPSLPAVTLLLWSSRITALIYLLMALAMLWSNLYGKQRTIRSLVATMNLHGDETILDIGCGRGMFLIEVAKKLTTGTVVGIDIWNNKDQSKNSAQATYQNVHQADVADKVQIKTADMRSLPFADATFDTVVSSLAIHNLYTQAEREQALAQLLRVLKPGGTFIVLDFRHTEQYATFLASYCSYLNRSSLLFSMFPPVRVVVGRKTS